MIWDEKIFENLNKEELRKFCNPFKHGDPEKQQNCLIIFVFVPVVIRK